MADPNSSPGGNLVEWLTEALAQRVAEALELMTGEPPQVAWSAGGEPSPDLLWWSQPLSLGQEIGVWIGAEEASWKGIGKHVLAAAGIEAADDGDVQNTYLEILGQALSGLARDLSARLRREVSCEQGAVGVTPPEGVAFSNVEIMHGEAATWALWVAVAPLLLETMRKAEEARPAEPAAVQSQPENIPEPAEAPTPAPAATLPGGRNPKTFELLLEVEMPVSVSFGRAELPLRDVLKLTTGSIIELNRTVNEPVEVIVNNCVIARGEVVVIEGNYGIRIREIISRQERLRTLK